MSVFIIALCNAATAAAPSSRGKTFLGADSEQIRFLGRVDVSDPANARMAWVMTGASASLTLAGPPVSGAVPAGDATGTYACEKNKNYEGENVSYSMDDFFLLLLHALRQKGCHVSVKRAGDKPRVSKAFKFRDA